MLFIVLHNKIDYLNSLNDLANKNGISNTKLVHKNDLGMLFSGNSAGFYFHKSCIHDEYDKGFIGVLSEKQAKLLLSLIEDDPFLNMFNTENDGVICVVPFENIRDLHLMSSSETKKTA
jgi:hypothetical protein